MNVVILSGRLTADPELKQLQNGTTCTSFLLAVDRVKNKDGQVLTDFPTIVCWRKTAEFACNYLHKGSRIIVRGELRTRKYEDESGKPRKITEVQADRIEFADSENKAKEG